MRGLFIRAGAVFAAAVMLAFAGGCVDQSQGRQTDAQDTGEVRLIATSRAAANIADRLNLALIGVPSLEGLPERYDDAERVGSAMGPDMEIIASLKPTEVFGPDTLGDNLRSGYEAANIPATFLNLRSVEGLYESIDYLGDKYGREAEALALIDTYSEKIQDFEEKKGGREGPRVLILMGLPGSYIECTQNSYVGNLAELAGAVNVVADDTEDFVSWNTEELLALDPDIIFLTAHALPDMVQEMFEEEFSQNDIWSHFRAVQEGRVYTLDHLIFSMSANFEWDKGLDTLYEIFYGDKGA